MSTTDDITAEIQSSLTDLQYIFVVYLANLPNMASYKAESTALLEEASELDRQLQEYDRIENAYDREFMDRKNNPVSRGFFTNMGLLTTQDWVLAFFFLSYIIFSIVIFIKIVLNAGDKMKASAFVFVITCVLGITMTSIISTYA